MHLSISSFSCLFSALNAHTEHVHARHPCTETQRLPGLFFLLIAYANFISREEVKVLVQSCSWSLDVFAVPDVFEKKIWQGSDLTNLDLKKLNLNKNDSLRDGNEFVFICRIKLLYSQNSPCVV